MLDETNLDSVAAEELAPSPAMDLSLPVEKLIGSYEKSIDSKYRILLPSQFRDKLGDHPLILIRWLKRTLAILPEINWLPIARKISQLELYTDFGLTVRHHIFGYAREIKMDKKEGRIIVPPDMADYARLNGKIMIMGDWDKITLCNYTYYQDQVAVDDVTFSERFPEVWQLVKGQKSSEAVKADLANLENAARL